MGIGTIEFSTSLKVFGKGTVTTLSCDITGTAQVDNDGRVYDVALDVAKHDPTKFVGLDGKTYRMHVLPDGEFLNMVCETVEYDYADEISALLDAREPQPAIRNIHEYI